LAFQVCGRQIMGQTWFLQIGFADVRYFLRYWLRLPAPGRIANGIVTQFSIDKAG